MAAASTHAHSHETVGLARWGAAVAVLALWLVPGIVGGPAAGLLPSAYADDRGAVLVENANTRELMNAARDYIERAELRSEEGNQREAERLWREAIEKFQTVFTDEDTRTHWIRDPYSEGFVGARAFARRQLLEGGELAQRLYQNRYNAHAQRLMDEALLNRTIESLERVILSFPFSSSAQLASRMAAQYYFERAQFHDAAAILDPLIRHPNLDAEVRADACAMLADAYARLGMRDEIRSLRTLAGALMPDARTLTGHAYHDLDDVLARAEVRATAWLRDPTRSAVVSNYGGDRTGNKVSPGPITPNAVRWTKEYLAPRVSSTHDFGLQYQTANPGFIRRFPVVDNGMVFLPNRYNLRACNLFSGNREWDFQVPIERGEKWAFDADPAVIYTAAVDGEQVYASLDTPYPPETQSTFGAPFFGSGTVILQPPRRRLYCLDRSSGRLLWSVGGYYDEETLPATDDEPERRRPLIERLSFTLSPIVVGDTVYCPASRLDQNASVYVVALDRNGELDENGVPTGRAKVRFITKIATSQKETNMFGRPTREPFPSAVVYGHNLVYICTNLGIVAAVDVRTGEQAWAAPYKVVDFYQPVTPRAMFRTTTWFANPPMLADNALIVTPADGERVLALDARTGRTLWTYQRAVPDRGHVEECRYVLGVRDGKVYFGGAARLFEIDVETGRLEGRVELTNARRGVPQRINGRGVIVGDRAYIPVQDGIAEVDLDSMSQRGTTTVIGYSGGNLVVAGSVLLIANDDEHDRRAVICAYDWDAIIEGLKQQERENPYDFAIALRLANLAWQNDQIDEAIRYFEKVLRLTREVGSLEAEQAHHTARRGLYAIYLDKAHEAKRRFNWAEVGRSLARARAYASPDDPAEAIELALMHIEYLRHENPSEIIPAYEQLIEAYGDEIFPFPPDNEMLAVGVYAHVQIARFQEAERRWDRALAHWQTLYIEYRNHEYGGMSIRQYALKRMRDIFDGVGRAPYAAIERYCRATYDEALAADPPDTGMLAGIVEDYPLSETAEDALLALAEIALDAGDVTAATDFLRNYLRDYAEGDDRGVAMVLLIETFEQRDMFHAARNLLRQLEREYYGRTVRLGNRAIDVDRYVRGRLESEAYAGLSDQVAAPTLSLPLRERDSENLGELTNPKVLNVGANVPEPYRDRIFVLNRGELQCRDTSTLGLLWKYSGAQYVYAAGYTADDRLCVVTSTAVVALRPDDGEVLFKTELEKQVQTATVAESAVALVLRERPPGSRQYRFYIAVVDGYTGAMVGTALDAISDNLFTAPLVRNGMVLAWSETAARLFAFTLGNPAEPAYTIYFRDDPTARVRIAAPVIIDDERYAVAINDTQINVHELLTGDVLTTFEGSRIKGNTLTVSRGKLLVIDGEGLLAVDPGTGRERFTVPIEGLYKRLVAMDDSVLLVTQDRDNTFRARGISLRDGDVVFDTVLGTIARWACQDHLLTRTHVMVGLRQYIPVTEDGSRRNQLELELVFLNRESGEITQRLEPDMGKNIVPTMLAQDNAFFLTASDALIRYAGD